MKNCFVCLGANGDMLNALPLVWEDFQNGNLPTMMIARQFESLLDGVSYCKRLVWYGHYSEFGKAADVVQDQFDNVFIPQCYGPPPTRLTDSFCKEAWRLVGKLDKWDTLPLVFDMRDREREGYLLRKVGNRDRPKVLVSTSGKSSPFPHREQLKDYLSPLKDEFDFIDLDGFKADRFYDLLGLYERAACLIATDSGPLHLAQAIPKLPVIALITHSPDTWHGSPARANHVLRMRYNEFPSRVQEIIPTLRGIVSKGVPDARIIHAWSDYPFRKPDAMRRHLVSKRSWQREYATGRWVSARIEDSQLTRTGRDVGELKPLPFVNDVINLAADSARPQDIICLTNDDSIFTKGITDTLLNHSPLWAGRFEHVNVNQDLDHQSVRAGAYKHCGADIFAFSKSWWAEHGHKFPDMLVAREAWDLVLRTLITKCGGREVEGLCAHIIHSPEWHSPEYRESPGNLFNRNVAREFFRANGMPWPQV